MEEVDPLRGGGAVAGLEESGAGGVESRLAKPRRARPIAKHVGRGMIAQVADQPLEAAIADGQPVDIDHRVGQPGIASRPAKRAGLDPRMAARRQRRRRAPVRGVQARRAAQGGSARPGSPRPAGPRRRGAKR